MNQRLVVRLILVLALLAPGWVVVQPATAHAQAGAPAPAPAERPAPAAPRETAPPIPAPGDTQGGANAIPAPGDSGQGGAVAPNTPGGAVAPTVGDKDGWDFDDEETEVKKEESWQDLLRPQLFDIAMMVGFLTFAMVSFFLKSRPLKYVALAMTVAYLGVVKSTMISITDIFRLVESGRAVFEIPSGELSVGTVASAVASGFPNFKDSVAWYIFATFTVVSTIVFGRVYCGRICAFGAFTQLMDAVLPKRLRIDPPKWLEKRASYIKYGLLVATVAYYALTKHFAVYRYVEPFWMYTRQADIILWTMLGALLLATVVVRNMYCRFLCPVGATLGILSTATIFGIKRWSECSSCKICEKTCEWGAIEGPKIIKTECVRCDDCERVYADQSKCPHWLIPIIRQRKIDQAKAAGRPVPQFIPLEKVVR